MSSTVSWKPEDYQSITPYLIVKNASAAIDFYKAVFSAEEVMRFTTPEGKIGHAELKIGDSKIMLADEYPDMNALSPQSVGGTPVGIHLFIPNVDDIAKSAVEHGATILRDVSDQFYGDRSGSFLDPFGHQWHVSTHIEDLTPEEIEKRARAQF